MSHISLNNNWNKIINWGYLKDGEFITVFQKEIYGSNPLTDVLASAHALCRKNVETHSLGYDAFEVITAFGVIREVVLYKSWEDSAWEKMDEICENHAEHIMNAAADLFAKGEMAHFVRFPKTQEELVKRGIVKINEEEWKKPFFRTFAWRVLEDLDCYEYSDIDDLNVAYEELVDKNYDKYFSETIKTISS